MAFGYYRTITIDHTKVGSGTQASFPVLIDTTNAAAGTKTSFKSTGNGGKVQSTSGYDIRPYADSGLTTALSFELVTYDASTGVFEMWVNAGTGAAQVNGTTDSVIYLAYGDSSLNTDGSSTSTWDSNFKRVWHLKDGSSLSGAESTSAGATLTNNSATATSGQIDGAANFSSADMHVGDSADYLGANFTWSGWLYSTGSGNNTFFMKGTYSSSWSYAFQINAGNTDFRIFIANPDTDGGSNLIDSAAGTFTANAWHHVAIFYDGSLTNDNRIKIYFDGASMAMTSAIGTIATTLTNDTGNFYLGTFNGLGRAWAGKIDEVHLSNSTRATSWIVTEYNNQNIPDKNNTGGFYTVGNETATSIIQFDAVADSGYQAASSSYTFNRTVAGTNRYLTVDVALLSAGQTVTSVIDDNLGSQISMTFIGARSTVSSVGRIESWGLVAPATGTKQIQVNLSGSIASTAVAVSYTGVHQILPTEAFNSNQATNVGAADATVTITPITDQTWVHAAIATDDTAITAGQTSRNNVSGAGGSGANEDSGPITPATGTTMTYTNIGALATWAIAGYALRPYTASSGETNFKLLTLLGVGN